MIYYIIGALILACIILAWRINHGKVKEVDRQGGGGWV